MFTKRKTHIAIAVSHLQTAFWFNTIWDSHRRGKRSILIFLVTLVLLTAKPLAAQEHMIIDPAGVVSWDELLKSEQRKVTPYVAKPKVVPFMPGPEPRSIDETGERMEPLSALTEDFAGEEVEPFMEIEDDFQALPDNNTAIPPDTMGAAGPNHLMTMLNTQVRIQNKTGTTISTVLLETFWTSGTGLSGEPFDPRLVYDPLANRWLATVDANPDSAASAVWFAVSDDSDPTGNWTFYDIEADDVPPKNTWADFPDIGVNSKWVAITNNMFTFGGDFSGVKMWVIDKSSLGGPLTVNVFYPADDPAPGGFTLRPAVTFDAAESTLYIVDGNNFWATATQFPLLRLTQITGTGPSPSWSVVPDGAGPIPGTGLFPVASPFELQQINASQLGTSTRVSTNDPRLLNAVFRNGRLWTTHSAGLPFDNDQFSWNANRTGVFWYQIDPDRLNTTGDPILQSGVLDGGKGVHHFFPSIAVNSANDVALGFSRSASSKYIEGVVTGRRGGYPGGSMDAIDVIKAGEDSYVKTFCGPSVRWGDYSATVVDPADDTTFWTIQQYAETDVGPSPSDDRWGTWWARVPSEELLIDPSQGTSGTEFSISGNDFGDRKGKVKIGEKKVKVLEWTNTSISCLVRKVSKTMGPGTYDVTIMRKGKGLQPILMANAFSVMVPEINEINPNTGSTRDEITITGSFFGTKKVKVFMANGTDTRKKCKVISLTMDSYTGASTLVIRVPQKLAPGLYDVIVTNKVGEDILVGGFTIE